VWIDKEYKLTDEHYTIDDFIEDFKEKRLHQGRVEMMGLQALNNGQNRTRYQAAGLDQIFGTWNALVAETTKQNIPGVGMSIRENSGVPFWDGLERISWPRVYVMPKSIMEWKTSSPRMICCRDTQYKSQMSTVLMIDISHSMILYVKTESRPPKVAMALAELITTRYPKDTF
jgi:hypothetical protein